MFKVMVLCTCRGQLCQIEQKKKKPVLIFLELLRQFINNATFTWGGCGVCRSMSGESQRRRASPFQISTGAIIAARYVEGLSEIGLVNSSFWGTFAVLLISYCTHLSIRGPRRVFPKRTGADIKCTQRKRKGRETNKQGGAEGSAATWRGENRRNEMQEGHSIRCFELKICAERLGKHVLVLLQLVRYRPHQTRRDKIFFFSCAEVGVVWWRWVQMLWWKINVWAFVQRGQVEAITLTSPQVSILTDLLLRYWIQLAMDYMAIYRNCWLTEKNNGQTCMVDHRILQNKATCNKCSERCNIFSQKCHLPLTCFCNSISNSS